MRGLLTSVLVVLVLLGVGCTAAPPQPAVQPDSPAERLPEPPWDPRDVDDLPAAGRGVAPGLPERVDPPDEAPLLRERPMDAAVLAIERNGGRIQLLGTDGSWRDVLPSERHPGETLSPDGTRLAALLSDRIALWHLPTGERSELPLPSRFQSWDYPSMVWVDGSTLLLDDRGGGWLVDVASGDVEQTSFPRRPRFSWMIDHDGVFLEWVGPGRPPAIFDWKDGRPRRIDLADDGILLRVDARGDLVVGTVAGGGEFGVFALDRSEPSSVQRLPLGDFDGNYSTWGLRTRAILEDGTALLWVAVPGRDKVDGWRLVRWTPHTGRLEVVTTSDADPTWWVSFARDLLDGSSTVVARG